LFRFAARVRFFRRAPDCLVLLGAELSFEQVRLLDVRLKAIFIGQAILHSAST
jgi:hypothetical protein